MKLSNFVKLALPSAVLALGFISTPASATSPATGTMTVSASVQTSCSVTATPLAFGVYTGTVVTSTSNITVLCNTDDLVTISLSDSTTSGGAYQMNDVTSSNSLNYKLFQDSAYTTLWGSNTTAMAGVSISGTISKSFPVYGQIPSNQNSPAESYTDTITVTVSY